VPRTLQGLQADEKEGCQKACKEKSRKKSKEISLFRTFIYKSLQPNLLG
jgi:hypothetical protein